MRLSIREMAWALGAVLGLSASSGWAAPELPTARVNGTAIPAEELDFLVAQARREGVQVTPEQTGQLREKLIDRQVVLQEARRLGIDRTPEVRLRARLAGEDIAIGELGAQVLAKDPVTDAEVQAAYQEIVAGLKGSDFRVHHILLASEADAKAAQASVTGGESFEAVARARSIDKASAAAGGDVGWVRETEYRPEVLTALRSLKPGQTFGVPVQSPSGWHILRLDEVRATQAPTLEQIQAQLRQSIGQRKFTRYQQQLRSQAKVQ